MGPLRIFNLTGVPLKLPSYLRLPKEIVDLPFSLRRTDGARALTAGDMMRSLVRDYGYKPDELVGFAFPGFAYRGASLFAAFNGMGRYTPEATFKSDAETKNISRVCTPDLEEEFNLETICRHPLKVARMYRFRIPQIEIGPTSNVSLDAEYHTAYALMRLLVLKKFEYPWIISNTLPKDTEFNWTCAYFGDCRLLGYTREYEESYL